jgi:hypothetical protein
MGCSITPFMQTMLVLNPDFSYSCNFDFEGEVMEGSLGVSREWYLIQMTVNPLIERWRCIGTPTDYLALKSLPKKGRFLRQASQ